LPRLTASEAENLPPQASFVLLRAEASHRIYGKEDGRIVVPFHAGLTLHPRIVKSVLEAVENSVK
jgi:predicted RNA binding protein YcfA (HicA-like mRNA interferase family)